MTDAEAGEFGNRRTTRDVDLAELDVSNDPDSILEVMREILTAGTAADDGLMIDVTSLRAEVIRDEDEYSGVRVSAKATLNTARLSFRVDVNVGDPIYPEPTNVAVPRLLGGEPIALRGYPLHMVLAEKLVTAVQRGTVSTRWRDFGDIWTLTRHHSIDGSDLQNAVTAVARHRQAALIPLPRALAGYAETSQQRWATWRRRTNNQLLPEAFDDVVAAVTVFGEPVLAHTVSGLFCGTPASPSGNVTAVKDIDVVATRRTERTI